VSEVTAVMTDDSGEPIVSHQTSVADVKTTEYSRPRRADTDTSTLSQAVTHARHTVTDSQHTNDVSIHPTYTFR